MLSRATQDGLGPLDGSTNRGPLEKGIGNYFSILALRTHEQYEKVTKYDSER